MNQRDEQATAWDRLSGIEWPARVGKLWGHHGSRFASAWDDLQHHDQVSVYRIILAVYRNHKKLHHYKAAVEAVLDVVSDAEGLGIAISPHKVHAAIRDNLDHLHEPEAHRRAV